MKTRSATPLFVLADRLGPALAREGVDRWVPAGRPQQNGFETAAWTILVTALAFAGVARALDASGLPAVLALVLAVPLTFAALHVAILAAATVVGLAGFGSRGQMRLWITVGTLFAAWLVVVPGWLRIAGWAWLGWILFNLIAWIINEVWEPSAGNSR